ncbi:MAG: efflux RND transporter periplasmic adaptor subunit [Verrucomicrobiota bacterium]
MKWNQISGHLPSPLRRKPILWMVLICLVALGIAYLAWPRSQEPATAFYEVKRGDFTVTVLDRGTIAAVSEVSIRSEVEGTARIIYIVPEGTYVKKGDLLVELDSSQAQDQVNQQQIAYEKAKFALAQAEAQLEIQKSATNSDIRAAQLKVKFAKLDLDKFDEGQSMVDLIESSNKVVQALAQLAVNRENFTWTTNLAQKGYETKQKVDVDRLAVMNNENALVVASNTLVMLQKFDLPKQREQFVSQYEEAIKELERVIAQSERKIAQYQADLVSQSNTLVLNEKKLQRDRKNLEATRREAPQEGLVVYAMSENRFSSESLIEEGAVVRNRQELIKLPDTSRMKVTIKVHESHVGLVQAGQPAFVKLDSIPDQRFEGVVQKVALLPDSQSRFGNPNLKVYNTEVVITDALPGVKPGVSAQAEIVITNMSDTLSVPLQAVTTLKGRQVVYVQQGSKTVPVPVQVGMFNTRFIQITSGVSEGDHVLLSPPFDTQEKDLEGAVLSAEDRAKAATNSSRKPMPAPSPQGGQTNPPVTQLPRPNGGPERATARPEEIAATGPVSSATTRPLSNVDGHRREIDR